MTRKTSSRFIRFLGFLLIAAGFFVARPGLRAQCNKSFTSDEEKCPSFMLYGGLGFHNTKEGQLNAILQQSGFSALETTKLLSYRPSTLALGIQKVDGKWQYGMEGERLLPLSASALGAAGEAELESFILNAIGSYRLFSASISYFGTRRMTFNLAFGARLGYTTTSLSMDDLSSGGSLDLSLGNRIPNADRRDVDLRTSRWFAGMSINGQFVIPFRRLSFVNEVGVELRLGYDGTLASHSWEYEERRVALPALYKPGFYTAVNGFLRF